MMLSKLILILINLTHKPKEGIFKTENGDRDYKYWILRTQVKKLVVWLINNSPLPWLNIWSFKWFGIKLDFSDSLTDAWCDVEFIKFGKNILVGQGAVVMSSMILGNYLIIKKTVIDDYSVIGGHSTISPGTIVGKESVVGALSITSYNQVLDKGWIYFGFPAVKLKPNKYAELNKHFLMKIDVDQAKKYKVKSEVNIDEDKKVFNR
jgi:carbonic anhydrase/acetyltransferase-like protein (isoleucine patch superfamily)